MANRGEEGVEKDIFPNIPGPERNTNFQNMTERAYLHMDIPHHRPKLSDHQLELQNCASSNLIHDKDNIRVDQSKFQMIQDMNQTLKDKWKVLSNMIGGDRSLRNLILTQNEPQGDMRSYLEVTNAKICPDYSQIK